MDQKFVRQFIAAVVVISIKYTAASKDQSRMKMQDYRNSAFGLEYHIGKRILKSHNFDPQTASNRIEMIRKKRRVDFGLPSSRLWYSPSIFGYFLRNRCTPDAAPCPTWSTWEGHDTCSTTCGGGERVLQRHCRHKKKLWGCHGPNSVVEECNTQPCPTWSDWNPITRCSRICGEGQLILSRNCVLDKEVVSGCQGLNSKIVPCVERSKCPPRWNSWSLFSPCIAPCEANGTQKRNRTCFDENGEKVDGCRGLSQQVKSCFSKVRCPNKYTTWTLWGSCNIPTGTWSHKERTRECLQPPCKHEMLFDIRPCQANEVSLNISSTSVRSKDSSENTSSDQPFWGWSQWSSCTTSCGKDGNQFRAKNCRLEENSNLTHPICDQKYSESRRCYHTTSCPHWATWLAWTKCVGNCSSFGTRSRRRSCFIKKHLLNEPNRANHTETSIRKERGMGCGKNSWLEEKVEVELCFGEYNLSFQERRCRTKQCQAYWLEWSSWSSCSSTCGAGYAISTRSCSKKNYKRCKWAEAIKYTTCFSPPCWSSWSAYSPCTTSCGSGGIKTRTRQCNGAVLGVPEYLTCVGNATDISNCNTDICPRWGPWGEFSECSKSCGVGRQQRRRTCDKGKCEGKDIIENECNFQKCPEWSQWSLLSCCSVTCGRGVKSRTRTCKHGAPGDCRGNAENVMVCDAGSCNATKSTEDTFICGRKMPPLFSTRRLAKLKIFGGKISTAQSWPWQVSLQHNHCSEDTPCWRHYCGGTLIHPQWVVTAGHCSERHPQRRRLRLDSPSLEWSVVFGTNTLNDVRESNRVAMRRIILHPKYRVQRIVYNDIEVIKLEQPIDVSLSAMPACLPEGTIPTEGTACFVTGWGHTESVAAATNALREAQIPILNHQQCQSLGYKFRFYLNPLYHMCAGDPITANADSCQGDSGGPLSCQDSEGSWYIAGVTSFGFESCGTPNNVGIYAPLAVYQNWVKTSIAAYSRSGC